MNLLNFPIQNTILPDAVKFWEQALMVRETKEVIRLNRKVTKRKELKSILFKYQTQFQCESTQVFVKNSLTHCIDSCKPITMCGEVQVPEEHLDVSDFFYKMMNLFKNRKTFL